MQVREIKRGAAIAIIRHESVAFSSVHILSTIINNSTYKYAGLRDKEGRRPPFGPPWPWPPAAPGPPPWPPPLIECCREAGGRSTATAGARRHVAVIRQPTPIAP